MVSLIANLPSLCSFGFGGFFTPAYERTVTNSSCYTVARRDLGKRPNEGAILAVHQCVAAIENGERIDPPSRVIDFRYTRKRYMRAYFNATLGWAR